MMRILEKDEVKELLLERLDVLVPDILPAAVKNGDEWRVGSVGGEEGRSLAIAATGDKAGLWLDRANPEEDHGDILDLIKRVKGLAAFPEVLKWARSWLGITPATGGPNTYQASRPSTPPTTMGISKIRTTERILPLPVTKEGKVLDIANERNLTSREKALQNHPEALAWLHNRQLTNETIRHFRIGLSSYGKIQDALVFPLLAYDGTPRSRYLNSRIPDVTGGVEANRKDWAAGSPATYWATPAEGKQNLLVVEGPRDAWRVWQAIQGTELEDTLAIISSTHGAGIPADWKAPEFWLEWDNVFLGQDADEAGDKIASRVRTFIHREVHRARPPSKDWTDWLNTGATPMDFTTVLDAAPILSEPIETVLDPNLDVDGGPGHYMADPVEINGAWIRENLYYPYRVLSRDIDEKGNPTHRYETLVLRSDGEAFSTRYLPAPEGTATADRVLALTDGTIIRRKPVVSNTQSFGLQAVNRFRHARKQGKSALEKTPRELLEAVERHLRRSVVLPHEPDYALLAHLVFATYVQRIFEAVPLVLINGAAGSGKSELAARLADLSCNGTVITGQTSAATAARVCDMTAGLVAFDDLEAIGERSRGNEFGELVQQLKVSYKQSTSKKLLTIMDRNGTRLETLDFFGIKVITNTAGVDDILGSRMLVIRTRKIKDANALKQDLEAFSTPDDAEPEELIQLRNQLHIWAMETAQQLHSVYRTQFARHSDRADEIAAPLRTVAAVINHPTMAAQLEAALDAQHTIHDEIQSDDELLKAAIDNLIRRGHSEKVSLHQIILEMESIAGPTWGAESTTEIQPWRRTKWVGRALRQHFLIEPNQEERPRLWPGGPQTRAYQLARELVEEVQTQILAAGGSLPEPVRNAVAFCAENPCRACPYRASCELQQAKQQKVPDDVLNA